MNTSIESAIIAKHDKLIGHFARKYAGPDQHEDLFQEGRVALLAAARTWQAINGATLWTYARVHVVSAMLRFEMTERAEPSRTKDRKDEGQGLYGAYRVLLEMPDIDSRTPETAADISRLGSVLASTLTAAELEVIGIHLGEGESLASTARELGLSGDKTGRLYLSAVLKLRDRLTPWSL